jgi:hypothetical protein
MKLNEINIGIYEGRLLTMAIAIITGDYETNKTPDEVLKKIIKLEKKVYKKQINQQS